MYLPKRNTNHTQTDEHTNVGIIMIKRRFNRQRELSERAGEKKGKLMANYIQFISMLLFSLGRRTKKCLERCVECEMGIRNWRN